MRVIPVFLYHVAKRPNEVNLRADSVCLTGRIAVLICRIMELLFPRTFAPGSESSMELSF